MTPSSNARRASLAERIQKVLADLGLGSRREIDRWVVQGRVTINGRAARPGDHVSGRERVCVDGRPVKRSFARRPSQPSFAAFYKPSGVPAVPGRATQAKYGYLAAPKHGRWIAASAPDTGAAGLVVLTTDGKLANRLTRMSSIEQEFAVRLLGQPTPAQIQRVTDGVTLEEGSVAAESIQEGGGSARNVWFHVVLRGGSRELRALLDAAGLTVSRMIRVRFGPIKLGTMRRGQSRPLSRQEVDQLRALVAEAGRE